MPRTVAIVTAADSATPTAAAQNPRVSIVCALAALSVDFLSSNYYLGISKA